MFRFFITLLSLFVTEKLLSMHRFAPNFSSRIAMRSYKTISCPYSTLGLKPGASIKAVEASYRNIVKQYHPDIPGGCRKKFEEAHKAREQIRNENRSLFHFFKTRYSGLNGSFTSVKESELKYDWRPYFWATFGVGALGSMVTSRESSQKELERRKKIQQSYKDCWESEK